MKDAARRIAYLSYGLWAAAATAVVLTYACVYAPMERSIGAEWAAAARSDAQVQRGERALRSVGAIEAARGRLRGAVAANAGASDADALAALVRQIAVAARRCGVAVVAIGSNTGEAGAQKTGGLKGRAISIAVRGPFEGTLAFLTALSASQPLLDVREVSMSVRARRGAARAVESRIETTLYRIPRATVEKLS